MSLLSSPTQRSKHLQRGLSLLRRATTSIEGLKTHAPPPPLPVMESISPSSRKRPFDDFPSSNPPPTERRVRFPKGKKSKKGGERLPVGGIDNEGEVLPVWGDANVAATERAKRRNRMIEEEVLGRVQPHHAGSFNEIVARSEVPYEENPSFDDSGVPLDPFNLDHEREEGYFDESGNYVEYMRNNEIKDAWLDSIDAEVKFVEPKTVTTAEREEEDYDDLSTAEIGRIKRSIANVLKPGETVMQALRRLKGTSGDKKQKMSEDTKCLFDDLTENAMKLMDNGEYNVYHEERETFEREAARGRKHHLDAVCSVIHNNLPWEIARRQEAAVHLQVLAVLKESRDGEEVGDVAINGDTNADEDATMLTSGTTSKEEESDGDSCHTSFSVEALASV